MRLAKTGVAAAAREGLLAMSVAVGLLIMGELLQAELGAKVARLSGWDLRPAMAGPTHPGLAAGPGDGNPDRP